MSVAGGANQRAARRAERRLARKSWTHSLLPLLGAPAFPSDGSLTGCPTGYEDKLPDELDDEERAREEEAPGSYSEHGQCPTTHHQRRDSGRYPPVS
jgi:hypothetical protein